MSRQQHRAHSQGCAAQYASQLRYQPARPPAQEAPDVLELSIVAVHPGAVDPIRPLDGRDDRESIRRELDIDFGTVASLFFPLERIGRPAVTPVDDDLEIVLEAKGGMEGRDEVRALERFAGDDAKASTLNRHLILNA